MAYGQPKMMADIDPYAYGGSASGEYEAQLEKAFGTFGPPAPPGVGGKVAMGAAGQLWQGIAAQQRAGQMAANRRGFSALAGRGATQAGAEAEAAGYGQQQALQAAEEEQRRRAALQTMQARSAYERQMGQIGTQAMGQALGQREFEAQLAAQKQAAEDARGEAVKEGLLGLGTTALGAIALSDERAKKDIEVADKKAQALLGRLGDEVVSDSLNRAKFSGEYGDPSNPKAAMVYTGDLPVVRDFSRSKRKPDAELEAMQATERDYARFLAEHADESEAEPEAPRDARDFAREGIAITSLGSGGPPPEARIGYGTVVPGSVRSEPAFRPEVPTREAMPVERPSYVPENYMRYAAESAPAREGFVRAMQAGAPAASEQARVALERMTREPWGGRTMRPASYEDAAQARRRAAIAEALDAADRAAQAKVRGADTRRQRIGEALDELDAAALEKVKPVTYQYRDGYGYGDTGDEFGVLAQDVAKVPVLRRGVVRAPDGMLALDPAKMTGPILGMLGNLGRRVSKVEGK